MSYISEIFKILYHIIYPYLQYNIRYNISKIYIFPTTEYVCMHYAPREERHHLNDVISQNTP